MVHCHFAGALTKKKKKQKTTQKNNLSLFNSGFLGKVMGF